MPWNHARRGEHSAGRTTRAWREWVGCLPRRLRRLRTRPRRCERSHSDLRTAAQPPAQRPQRRLRSQQGALAHRPSPACSSTTTQRQLPSHAQTLRRVILRTESLPAPHPALPRTSSANPEGFEGPLVGSARLGCGGPIQRRSSTASRRRAWLARRPFTQFLTCPLHSAKNDTRRSQA